MSGIILVGTIGTAIIVAVAIENQLIKTGKFVESDILGGIFQGVLTIGGIAASIWFIMSAIGRFIL